MLGIKINSGDERSIKIKRNIIASLFIKMLSIIVSLVLVPVTLGYLNPYEYGVWLTMSSILVWINYFDIGLGNGLRNKLAEALACGDVVKGRIYVSTTFCLLFILMLCIYVLYFIAHYWIDWKYILSISENQITTDLNSLVLLIFAFFCLSFVLKFIGNVYMAKQLPLANDIFVFLGNFISLVVIYVLTRTTKGDITNVAITFSVVPVIVYIIAYPITFKFKYKELSPSLSFIDFSYARDLIFLGGQFFIIQIACLIIFSTSNFFIAQFCGPEDVTLYNIAFKYFSVITMGFTIIVTPFWSAATEAYVKGDYMWIRKSISNMLKVWVGLAAITIFMLLVSGWVYYYWVGMKIPFSLSILLTLYVLISNWINLFSYFINGIGKIRLQLYCSIFSAVIFIPLAIFLGKLMGVNGICISMPLSIFISAIVLPIQCKHIINKRNSRFWNK